MKIDAGLDTGPMLLWQSVPIGPDAWRREAGGTKRVTTRSGNFGSTARKKAITKMRRIVPSAEPAASAPRPAFAAAPFNCPPRLPKSVLTRSVSPFRFGKRPRNPSTYARSR